jgi:hypothetical protein
VIRRISTDRRACRHFTPGWSTIPGNSSQDSGRPTAGQHDSASLVVQPECTMPSVCDLSPTAMPVRCTNIVSILRPLSAALLLFIIGGLCLTSAQETKQSHEVAKTTGNAKFIARGKYIVEGIAGCGYCHTPRDKNGDPDPTRWLAGAPGVLSTSSTGAGLGNHGASACRLATWERRPDHYTAHYLNRAQRPASPRPDASFSHDTRGCGVRPGLPEVT